MFLLSPSLQLPNLQNGQSPKNRNERTAAGVSTINTVPVVVPSGTPQPSLQPISHSVAGPIRSMGTRIFQNLKGRSLLFKRSPHRYRPSRRNLEGGRRGTGVGNGISRIWKPLRKNSEALKVAELLSITQRLTTQRKCQNPDHCGSFLPDLTLGSAALPLPSQINHFHNDTNVCAHL